MPDAQFRAPGLRDPDPDPDLDPYRGLRWNAGTSQS